MTVELKPEQERMIEQQLAGGRFKSVDEVLTTALSLLPHKQLSNHAAVARMIKFSSQHSVKRKRQSNSRVDSISVSSED